MIDIGRVVLLEEPFMFEHESLAITLVEVGGFGLVHILIGLWSDL